MEKAIINQKETQKGITLIALVITIIVLLILAGVSIAMLTGQNGILTQAQNAKTTTENKSAEEKVKLAVMGARADVGLQIALHIVKARHNVRQLAVAVRHRHAGQDRAEINHLDRRTHGVGQDILRDRLALCVSTKNALGNAHRKNPPLQWKSLTLL